MILLKEFCKYSASKTACSHSWLNLKLHLCRRRFSEHGAFMNMDLKLTQCTSSSVCAQDGEGRRRGRGCTAQERLVIGRALSTVVDVWGSLCCVQRRTEGQRKQRKVDGESRVRHGQGTHLSESPGSVRVCRDKCGCECANVKARGYSWGHGLLFSVCFCFVLDF